MVYTSIFFVRFVRHNFRILALDFLNQYSEEEKIIKFLFVKLKDQVFFVSHFNIRKSDSSFLKSGSKKIDY